MLSTSSQLTTKYPLDFDLLQKGDTIPVKRLVHLCGAQPGTRAYSLYCVQLGHKIEKELAQRGLDVTVAMRKCALCILTDSEASEYNHSEVQRGFDRMKRRHAKLLTVDTGTFDQQQKARHDRHVVVAGAMVLAAYQARKQACKGMPYTRKTPGLLPGVVKKPPAV